MLGKIHVHMHICIYTYIYMCMQCIYIYIYEFICVYIYIYMYLYTHPSQVATMTTRMNHLFREMCNHIFGNDSDLPSVGLSLPLPRRLVAGPCYEPKCFYKLWVLCVGVQDNKIPFCGVLIARSLLFEVYTMAPDFGKLPCRSLESCLLRPAFCHITTAEPRCFW